MLVPEALEATRRMSLALVAVAALDLRCLLLLERAVLVGCMAAAAVVAVAQTMVPTAGVVATAQLVS